MFVRNPDCLASEAVNFTDSAPVRAPPARNPPQLANSRRHEACDLDDVVSFAPSLKTAAGKTYAVAAALQAWARRAAAGRRRPRAYHRKRPHEPTINAQSALDFAAEVNARFNHASAAAGAYPVLPLHAAHAALCCPRHRKALYAALVALAVAIPAYPYEIELPSLGLEVAVPHGYGAIAPIDDARLVGILKHGLRSATALFAHHSSHASARNVATMTAGIRN